MADKIKLRNGTAAAWDSADPTLLLGERGLETDTRKAKTGDGSTAWGSLPYDDYPKLSAKSASYTVLDDDSDVFEVTTAASNRTMTLPTLADNADRVLEFHKIDSGAGVLIIDGEGAETIDGATTVQLPGQYNYVKVRAGTAGWLVVAMTAIYDSGWVNQSDLTDLTATITHNLGVTIDQLHCELSFATAADGTGAIQAGIYITATSADFGVHWQGNDSNSIILQTGATGVLILSSAGISTQEQGGTYDYYRVIIERIK